MHIMHCVSHLVCVEQRGGDDPLPTCAHWPVLSSWISLEVGHKVACSCVWMPPYMHALTFSLWHIVLNLLSFVQGL